MPTTPFSATQELYGGMLCPDGTEYAAYGTLAELLVSAASVEALDLWVSPTGYGDNPVEIPLP